MKREELYFSVDIETDGPIPGCNSMLSFGCVVFTENGEEISSFEANLEILKKAAADPDTMKWWKTQPEAWKACRRNLQEPHKALQSFVIWVEKVCADKYKPVMVCMPSGFDFLFMYWYMIKFAGKSPFSFSCVDMRTYVMAMRKTEYKKTGKRYWPKRWFPKLSHTHVAVEDAREQGITFINMMKENNERK